MHTDTDNMPVTSGVDCLMCLIGFFVLLIMWTRPSAPSSSEFTQKMFCVVCQGFLIFTDPEASPQPDSEPK